MGPSIPPMFKLQDLPQSPFPGNIANIDAPDRAYVALKASCDRQGHYPCNLLQRKQLQSATERYRRYLEDGEKTLFNLGFEEIHFLELKENSTDFQEFVIRNTPSVQKRLHQDDRDPTSRFVFIQADHSRAPLNCSRDSFSHILSYHQVPPSFVDYVAAFGATHYPTDYHMTGFDSDDTLTVKDSNVVKISKLGRSGREHRMQYLLRSIETDSIADESRRWNIRQTAVYHSFDFIEGKALWINIKANSRLEDMVKEATADSAIVNPAAMNDPAESFSSTLTIHLIFLEWCDMDWRKCINDCEKKIRTVIAKTQTSQVTPPAKFNTPTKRAREFIEARTSDLSSNKKLSNPGHSLWQWTLRRRPKLLHWDIEINEKLGTVQNEQYVQEQQLDYLNNLDSFSFDEIQNLHHWGEQLESYRLVMELNHQAMRDIVERYQNLLSRPDSPEYIKIKCTDDINYFVQRVIRIQKNLEIRIVQVKSLISWLEDGKSLFDRIVQYRNAQIGRIFTESSFGQSQKMERIAYKTEKETISMHVITCVTLAFLPPMFVATFFQSGLVEVNAGATSVSNAVIFHDNAFGLFAAICFPLMAVTFVLWVAVFRCLSKRSRSRVTSDVVLA